jgi:catechol 2,3-dioxygenase-like lactoylglutathione lyase family enzyme
MISGAHIVLYSSDPDADRAFFRDVFELKSVDAGGGWLLFALPPTEAAFHPSAENGAHELFFMCEDLHAEIAALAKMNIKCSEIEDARWGSIVKIGLPGGGDIRLYQPTHLTAFGKRQA